jgi:hypothetical protein
MVEMAGSNTAIGYIKEINSSENTDLRTNKK